MATMYRPDDAWGPRHVVRGGATALGSIGFFGPPEPAPDGVLEAEVGYGLVEGGPRLGFATEALTALLVETDRAGVRVRASVEPENKASIRVSPSAGSPSCAAATRTATWSWPGRCRPHETGEAARAGRHRPRRHPGPRRRERVAVHPRRCWARRGGRHPGRVRDRSAAAVDRGGLRARRVARHRDRLQQGARLGRRPAPAAPGAPHRARAGVSVCELLRAAVPGTSFAVERVDGIGLEPEFRERYGIPEGCAAPGGRAVRPPALKLLARHEQLAPQEFWDVAEEAVGGRLVITWSSTTALLEISAPG